MAASSSRYHSAHDDSTNAIFVALIIAVLMSVAVFVLIRMEESKDVDLIDTSAMASVYEE